MSNLAHIAFLLRTTAAFAQLSDETSERVIELTSERILSPGEYLVEEGDRGDALFFIVSGSLRVTRHSTKSNEPLLLAPILPGQVVGELSLLTGHPRAATLQAAESTTIRILERESFEALCAQLPGEMAATRAWMNERLDAYQISTAIEESPLLRNLSHFAKLDFAEGCRRVDLSAGQTLFRQGEAGNALYLILSGRLRIVVDRRGTPRAPEGSLDEIQTTSAASGRLLAELGKGDLLGEMALLTDEPRSATAIAVRDSHVARLDRAAFDRIVSAHPKEMLSLVSRQLADRLRIQNTGRKTEGQPPVAIAVLPLACGTKAGDSSMFARQLVKELAAFGPTLHLNRFELKSLLGGNRWADGRSESAGIHPQEVEKNIEHSDDVGERRLLAWLDDQELSHRHVVYEADAGTTSWTTRCLRQADLVLVVVDASGDIQQCAQALRQVSQGSPRTQSRRLVLVHPENLNGQFSASILKTPFRTAEWKREFEIGEHHHVRHGNSQDAARTARSINRQQVGLALGGGFALGLAHIGVIDAMRELQIPIDFVGGTSMGAIIAAACAEDYSHDQILEVMDRGCAQALKGDYTLPLVSLLTGRKVNLALGKYLEGLDIEDLWLPYYAVSASLVHARMVVHRSGSALRSVLASCRAPGMFPPLGWDGDVLVDGGLVNNIPADVMRDSVGSGTVFAADVSPVAEFSAGQEFATELSGWRVARRNANPFRNKRKIGTLADILMRLVRLGGVAHNRQIRASADLYMSVPLQQFSIRDFGRGEEMAKIGRAFALKELEAWIGEHGRPWLGDAV